MGLIISSGQAIPLQGRLLNLGSANFPSIPQPAQVSRFQASAELQSSGKLRISSTSPLNPTLVLQAPAFDLRELEELLLLQGCSAEESIGSRICQYAANKDILIELCGDISAPDTGDSHAAKQPRLESDSVNASDLAAQHRADPISECPLSLEAASHSQLTEGSGCAVLPPEPLMQAPPIPAVPREVSAHTLIPQIDSIAVSTVTTAATIRTSEDQTAASLETTMLPTVTVESVNMRAYGEAGLNPTAVAASFGAEERHSPTVRMLVGMPGSGKSFFAGALCDESTLAWVRVNQDSVRGGNSGTRKQCIAAMKQAMTQGSNVVVDRSNFDASQRTDFIALAHQLGSQVHVVMLKLPLQLCVERVTGRQDHEGGVEGGDGAVVVQRTSRLLNRAGLPTTSEGIASVTVPPSQPRLPPPLPDMCCLDERWEQASEVGEQEEDIEGDG